MKIQNIIRMQAIMIGLGAALFLTTSTRAQEITNSSFDESRNCVAFSQPDPVPAATDLNSSAANSDATIPVAVIATPIVTQAAIVSLWNSIEGWVIASFLFCVALVALYALLEAKRANRNLEARIGSKVDRRAVLS